MNVEIGIDDEVCWDGVCDAGLRGRKKGGKEEGMGGGGSDKGRRSMRYQGEVSDECCYGGSCVIVSLCLVCPVAETSAFLPLNAYIFLTPPNTVIAPSPSNSFLCTKPLPPLKPSSPPQTHPLPPALLPPSPPPPPSLSPPAPYGPDCQNTSSQPRSRASLSTYRPSWCRDLRRFSADRCASSLRGI